MPREIRLSIAKKDTSSQSENSETETQEEKKSGRSFNPRTILKRYREKKAAEKLAKKEKETTKRDIAFAQQHETRLRQTHAEESSEPEILTLGENEMANAFMILDRLKKKKAKPDSSPNPTTGTNLELAKEYTDPTSEVTEENQTEPELSVEKPVFYLRLTEMFKEEQSHVTKLETAKKLDTLISGLEISPADLAEATPEDTERLENILEEQKALEAKTGKTIQQIRNEITSVQLIEDRIAFLKKQKNGEVISSEVIQILNEWIKLYEGISVAQAELAKSIQEQESVFLDGSDPFNLKRIANKYDKLQELRSKIDDIRSLVETSNKLLQKVMEHVEKLQNSDIKSKIATFIAQQEEMVYGDEIELDPEDEIIYDENIQIVLKNILAQADLTITDLDPKTNPDLAELYKELGVEVTQDDEKKNVFTLTNDSALRLLILSKFSSEDLATSTQTYFDSLKENPAYATAAALELGELISSQLNYANLDLIISSALQRIKEKQKAKQSQESQAVADKNEKNNKTIFGKAKAFFAKVIRNKKGDDESNSTQPESLSNETDEARIDEINTLLNDLSRHNTEQ